MIGVFKNECVMVLLPFNDSMSGFERFSKFVKVLGQAANASPAFIDKVLAVSLVRNQYGQYGSSPLVEAHLPLQSRVIDEWQQTHDTPPFAMSVDDGFGDSGVVLGVRAEYLEELRGVLDWRQHYPALAPFFGEDDAWRVVEKWVRIWEGLFYVLDNRPSTPTDIFPSEVVGRNDLTALLSRRGPSFRALWGSMKKASAEFRATRNKIVEAWMGEAKEKRVQEWLGRFVGAN